MSLTWMLFQDLGTSFVEIYHKNVCAGLFRFVFALLCGLTLAVLGGFFLLLG